MSNDLTSPQVDIDAQETLEWIDALKSVIEADGSDRARFLLKELTNTAREAGAQLPYGLNTPYLNTIPVEDQPALPADRQLEFKIRSMIRWNAAAMVLRANKISTEYGGHIASYASAAVLYEIGFNHFWRARSEEHGGDMIYYQGHSAPGMYARAFMEGRLTEEQLDNFRQEVGGNGLSSYPHPWLMPDFWQFPTVSMGLGPIMAIYQARFQRYLENRELIKAENRKVWAFLGDGEMDEPESRGALGLAGREKLDNLIFVINCNLQRLDGPVRGNGKIIQELESEFRGAGWNVIKVIWGSQWDILLEKDHDGLLQKRMQEAVDGEYQAFKAKGGAYIRDKFWNTPELKAMVAHMSDEDLELMSRGGHDTDKVYAAYRAAVKHSGQPTVILAKTVKGLGMGASGQGQNTSHQQKKMDAESLKGFRNRFKIPVSDEQLEKIEYIKPDPDSPEIKYLHARRQALGGYLPKRPNSSNALTVPSLDSFAKLLESSGDREISSTMAFVRILSSLVRDKNLKDRIVPIVPDEARTFGMEGLFRQLGIYASEGQLYEPEDSDQLMYYREDVKGQVLEEGINEAGAMSSWIAAATSYSTNELPMVPFYIYYSMFGFQRIGDLAWAAGDMQARGFLVGGTAGRTTLAGEGLQHQDGHSHLQASTIPNCVSYDPTYSYELAVIVQDGLRRMYAEQENIFYYLTVMNENYVHPAMPKGAEEGILKGLYQLSKSKKDDGKTPTVQLMGSGTILNECVAAAELLEAEYGVAANVWSATSMNELRREGLSVQRWNMLHPSEKPKISYVEHCLQDQNGPVIAATDYMKIYADSIREFVPSRYVVLGTDGFGRSDDRQQLRSHFEVNREHIVVAALSSLLEDGSIEAEVVNKAIKQFNIDPEKPSPDTL
ncbi:pyruvate dehydrogenase (acetyl-transferring), homodimeric type [Arenicella xantha]|uniref:Pyruvate dehydrogenase E1 component n=1 Tax=Arenicella xantha TaxID=644221 RepID=A0A395JFE4_9GAMM|nr:pyruvate dehydrogenase (acetyl-transferring), homodimeric type [Arenicella xantha]RBP48363.1 pyruvate dehydrogenase E1 component [Arenicella xantha]